MVKGTSVASLGLSTRQSAWKDLLTDYKSGAASRGHVWELTDQVFKKLIKGDCYWCGAAPAGRLVAGGTKALEANGIDRLYNEVGYTITNSVSCCTRCNLGKAGLAPQEFVDWICKVYAHLYDNLHRNT